MVAGKWAGYEACAQLTMRISCAMAVRTERRGRSLQHKQTGQPEPARVLRDVCRACTGSSVWQVRTYPLERS